MYKKCAHAITSIATRHQSDILFQSNWIKSELSECLPGLPHHQPLLHVRSACVWSTKWSAAGAVCTLRRLDKSENCTEVRSCVTGRNSLSWRPLDDTAVCEADKRPVESRAWKSNRFVSSVNLSADEDEKRKSLWGVWRRVREGPSHLQDCKISTPTCRKLKKHQRFRLYWQNEWSRL